MANGKWSLEETWHNSDVSMYMNSPVIVGDRLFGFSEKRKGQLFCLDATTGKTIWLGPPRQAENAALWVAGKAVVALLSSGRLVVIDPESDEFTPLAEYEVSDSPTWAHPAMFAGKIVIKDESTLTVWSLD